MEICHVTFKEVNAVLFDAVEYMAVKNPDRPLRLHFQ